MRRLLAPLLFLLVPVTAGAGVEARSPFASWADDVASLSATAARPFLGREVRFTTATGVQVDRSRPLGPALDRSGPFVRADVARDEGWTGRGVLVAVIDSGVDFAHAAFLDASGRPRIVWYLDMTLPSRGTAGPLDDLGFALFSRDDLATALLDPAAPRPAPDTTGHGTRVASIAAGGAEPFPGLAPGAELIVVRADRLPGGRYDEADVADALRFAFAAADLLGRPCVANLSLGGQAGAHDGSSWLEQAIDALAWEGPGGRAVVVSAGNDADAAIHARFPSSPGAAAAASLVVPTNAGFGPAAPAVAIVDFWSAAGSSFALEVTLLDGSVAVVDGDQPALEVPLGGGAALRLQITEHADDETRGFEAIAAWTGGDDGVIPPGRYPLRVRGTAPVDAWLSAEADTGFFPFRLEGGVRDDVTLSLPATAHGALAVGSVTVRASWTNHLGVLLEDSSAVPGVASRFSARGPTADGRFKPDLLAPGEWIVGAQSAAAELPAGPGGGPASAVDETWSAARGTSLAAPHVAGAVALLLEREPWLHPRAIRDRLRAAARSDTPWDAQSAFGILDAAGILALADESETGSPTRAVVSVARVSVEPGDSSTIEAAVGLRTPSGEPRSAVEVGLEAAFPLHVRSTARGEVSTYIVDVSRLAPGQCAALTAVAPGAESPTTANVCARAFWSAGCAVAANRGSGAVSLVVLLLFAAAASCRSKERPAGVANGTLPGGGPRPRPVQARRWPFVAASVAVHVLLLAPLAVLVPLSGDPGVRPYVAVSLLEPPDPPPAEIRLAEPPAVVPESPAPTEPSSTTTSERPPSEPAKRPDEGRRRVPTAAARSLEPAVPVGTGGQAEAEGPSVESGASAVPPFGPALPGGEGEGATSGEAGGSGSGEGEGAASDGAGTFEPPPDPCRAAAADLRAAVDARKRYPPLARRRGLVGTAVVSFALAADGSVFEAAVTSSSGVALLDEAALAAVREAAPFRIGDCRFELPVRFSLP